MKKTLLLFIIIFAPGLCIAQTINLKGRVVGNSNDPVIGAIISISNIDSSIQETAISNNIGEFTLKVLPGSHLISIKHISYATTDTAIMLHKDSLLTFKLQEQIINARDVIVTAKKRPLRFEDGKLVVDVSRIPNSQQDNLADIMSKLPGILITEDGITLNGQSVTIQLNGIDQKIQSGNLVQILKAIPGSSVGDIELFLNKTADQSLTSGSVINIKTKNNYLEGYLLQFTAGPKFYFTGNMGGSAGLYFAFNSKKLLLNATYNYGSGLRRTHLYDSTQYNDNSIFTNTSNSSNRGNSNYASINAQYIINKQQNLNMNFSVYDEKLNIHKNNISRYLNQTNNTLISNKEHDDLWSLNFRYQIKDSSKYDFSVGYGLMWGGVKQDINYTFDKNNDVNQYDNMTGLQHELKADFKWNIIPNLKLNIGTKLNLGNLNESNIYEPALYDGVDFNGRESLIAFYASLSYKISDYISLYGGGRAEYTDFNINHNLSKNSYWNVFPYFSISFSAKQNYKASLAFSPSIDRPNYFWMIPGITYIDEKSYKVGNPNLLPEKFYSVNFDQMFLNFIYLRLSYNYWKGVSGQVLIEKEDNILEYTYKNYADYQTFYGGLTIPFQLKGLSGEASIRAYYRKYLNPINEVTLPEKNGSFDFTASLYAKYTFLKQFSINVYAYYKSKAYGFQSIKEPIFNMDLGVSYSFLKDQSAQISLTISDVINSLNNNSRYNYYNNIKYISSNFNSQSVKLTFSYRIKGGKKPNNSIQNSYENDRFRKD